MIKGKFVNLRALEENDLEKLKIFRNQDFVRSTTREFKLLNMKNQKIWFESIHKENPSKFIMFGIEDQKNMLIGVCGLTYIDWKNKHAEISIILSRKNWQKSKEAKNTIKILLNYGFAELNLHRLWVEIFEGAKENIQLFEKMNFSKEGKLREKLWRNGKWQDSFIYSKLVTEHIEKENKSF